MLDALNAMAGCDLRLRLIEALKVVSAFFGAKDELVMPHRVYPLLYLLLIGTLLWSIASVFMTFASPSRKGR